MDKNQLKTLFPSLKSHDNTLHVILMLAQKHRLETVQLWDFLTEMALQKKSNINDPNLQNPDGYLVACIKNKIWKEYKSKVREISIEYVFRIPDVAIHEFEIINKSTLQKLNDLYNKLAPQLSEKLRRLFQIMVELAPNDYPSYEFYIRDVKRQAIQRGISEDNFYKLCERLRKAMRPHRGTATDLLQPTSDSGLESLVEFMAWSEGISIALDENCRLHGLNKMEFTDEELRAFDWLEKLAKENGFEASVEDLEIYYDDLDKVKKLCPCCEPEKEDRSEKNPDFLGVYRWFLASEKEICLPLQDQDATEDKDIKLRVTHEGVIILFRDRIEKQGLSEREIATRRYIVLMHELGHWLCHWPLANGMNWKIGYFDHYIAATGFNNPSHLHEGFAQLVAYWATLGKLEYRNYLEQKMTPDDTKSPYRSYLNLINRNQSDIFKKIIQLRFYGGLKDQTAFAFLESDKVDLKEYLVDIVYSAAEKAFKDSNEISRLNKKDFMNEKFIILLKIHDRMIELDSANVRRYFIAFQDVNKNHKPSLIKTSDLDYSSGAAILNRFGGFLK